MERVKVANLVSRFVFALLTAMSSLAAEKQDAKSGLVSVSPTRLHSTPLWYCLCAVLSTQICRGEKKRFELQTTARERPGGGAGSGGAWWQNYPSARRL